MARRTQKLTVLAAGVLAATFALLCAAYPVQRLRNPAPRAAGRDGRPAQHNGRALSLLRGQGPQGPISLDALDKTVELSFVQATGEEVTDALAKAAGVRIRAYTLANQRFSFVAKPTAVYRAIRALQALADMPLMVRITAFSVDLFPYGRSPRRATDPLQELTGIKPQPLTLAPAERTYDETLRALGETLGTSYAWEEGVAEKVKQRKITLGFAEVNPGAAEAFALRLMGLAVKQRQGDVAIVGPGMYISPNVPCCFVDEYVVAVERVLVSRTLTLPLWQPGQKQSSSSFSLSCIVDAPTIAALQRVRGLHLRGVFDDAGRPIMTIGDVQARMPLASFGDGRGEAPLRTTLFLGDPGPNVRALSRLEAELLLWGEEVRWDETIDLATLPAEATLGECRVRVDKVQRSPQLLHCELTIERTVQGNPRGRPLPPDRWPLRLTFLDGQANQLWAINLAAGGTGGTTTTGNGLRINAMWQTKVRAEGEQRVLTTTARVDIRGKGLPLPAKLAVHRVERRGDAPPLSFVLRNIPLP